MKKNVAIMVLVIALAAAFKNGLIPVPKRRGADTQAAVTKRSSTSTRRMTSGEQIRGAGVVTRILSDDTVGSRHQRFIIRLSTGQTLLVAHNIDLARRVQSLSKGDRIEFCGEYEWNAKGGVVHWTHHDPAGRHPTGWIRHKGRTYR